MSYIPKILAFAGSTRTDSFNKKMIRVAVAGAQEAGAQVTLIDLRDFPLPVYDGDLEAASGLPENALKLKKIFLEHHGLLISSPEYNSSVPGGLKNMIDWVSRGDPKDAPLACFKDKVAALMSASPGNLGGSRALVHLRAILGNISVLVLPQQVSVPKATDAFGADGQLKEIKQQDSIKKLGRDLAAILVKLRQ